MYLLQNHLHSSLVIILILSSTTTPKGHPGTHTYNTHSHKYMFTHIFVIINFYNGCSFYFQNFPFILLHSPILDIVSFLQAIQTTPNSDSVTQHIITIMLSSYLMIMSPHSSSKTLTEKLNRAGRRVEPAGCWQPLSSGLVLIHSLALLQTIFQPGTKPVHPTSISPHSSLFSTKTS